MTELKGWCVQRHNSGYIEYSATHQFIPYETLILKRPKYYCKCGKKISPEEYIEYSKYLIARKRVGNKNA